MIKQLFDPGFLMVPSCFGCDSSNVSLDFFPHQNILNILIHGVEIYNVRHI